MDYTAAPLEKLIEEFGKFQGVGRKGATRMAYQVLSMSDKDAAALADAIRTLADDPERRWMMRRRGLMRSRSFGQQAYYQNFVQLLEYYQTLDHKKEP